MATIYALLVGINEYPGKPLAGCVNDVQAFREYLETGSGEVVIRTLVAPGSGPDASPTRADALPTRADLIAAFALFDAAKENDTCVFYYSGHGSFSDAPPEFDSPDGREQSFVCYDSRQPGGKDLMGKEMGFLIWQTMQAKPDVNFIAITDCCFSGKITKAIDVTDRLLMENGHVPTRVEDYLGFDVAIGGMQAYEDKGAGKDRRVTTLQGRHIHLSASQDSQTSKELLVDGKTRGAFTHSLLKALYTSDRQINYIDLLERVRAAVRGLVDDQEPDVQVRGGLSITEKEKIFLSQKYAGTDTGYLVYYDRRYGWSLEGGRVHGINKGDAVRIAGVCNTIVTGSAGADRSVILSMLELGTKDKRYVAQVERRPDQPLAVSLAPDIDGAVGDLIRQARVANPSPFVSLLPDQQGRMIIRRNPEDRIYLALPGSERPFFEPVIVSSSGEATDFLYKVEKVGRWMHLLAFDNPRPRLSSTDYSLRLFVTSRAGDYDAAGLTEVELTETGTLVYRKQDGVWYQPAFRLVVENCSEQTLYITAVYLEFDYSITPGAFEDLALAKGHRQELRYVRSNGRPDPVVLVRFDRKYQELGYSSITEYLKLFISTTRKVPVDRLKQDGLDLPMAKGLGEEGYAKGVPPDDWRTAVVGLTIIGPVA
jgi:Caspase domain